VDRSGAYIVRQAAKSIVAAGLARRVIVQVCILSVSDMLLAQTCLSEIVARGRCLRLFNISNVLLEVGSTSTLNKEFG